MGSKIKEVHTLTAEGTLNLDSEEIMLEVEDFIEPVKLRDLFRKFNGCVVKLTIKLANEITDE